jgi:hypothetical protein
MTTHALELLLATTAFGLAVATVLGAAFVALEPQSMLRLPGFATLVPDPPRRLQAYDRMRRPRVSQTWPRPSRAITYRR